KKYTLVNLKDLLMKTIRHMFFDPKKALYGLKQAPRAWYDLLSKFLLSQQFVKGVVDPTLFTRKEGEHIILVQIYVDDIIFAFTNPSCCDNFANQMSKRFRMSMMGKMSFFLGLQISQSPRGIFINQSKYALEMLKKYGLDRCDHVDILMVERLKLDEDLNRTLTKPTEKHLTAVKRVFWYLKGTINMGLWYLKDTGFDLMDFAYVDHAGCQDPKKSTSGSAQFLGEKLVSWSSKKQKCTAISIIKAEYISVSVQNSRTKHIAVRYHSITELVENEIVEHYFVKSAYQLADIFTKVLARERFEFLVKRLGMQSITPEELKLLADCAYCGSLLLTPLCCDDIHDVTPCVSALAGCDRLASESLVIKNMSPPRRQRYCWNIAFATGCRRVGRRKWTNRRIRVPAFMRSCRIEEELTWVKTFGKEVEEYVTKVIAKDGTVTRFGGRFPHFIEEEEEKKPKPYNLYGFVDLMENEQVYAKTGFAPHRIPQSEGNHNGWLSEEEEADSDSESTASNCPHTV
ncbi:retrovirus-related pol polyprotein from transposon TNT 1-94, partial [Tanacetum coccineum]